MKTKIRPKSEEEKWTCENCNHKKQSIKKGNLAMCNHCGIYNRGYGN